MTLSTNLPVIHMNVHLEMSEGASKCQRQDGSGGRVSTDAIRQFACNVPFDGHVGTRTRGAASRFF